MKGYNVNKIIIGELNEEFTFNKVDTQITSIKDNQLIYYFTPKSKGYNRFSAIIFESKIEIFNGTLTKYERELPVFIDYFVI